MTDVPAESSMHHRSRRMVGRDPDERHRAATPLELLFDLTFVVAFGTAANELAHAITEDHVVPGIIAFAFATFAVSWAWINFTWFASAYDTDDWIYRLTTMVQMVGVLILALGLPAMFASVDDGDHLDNDVMVWGYVVMRVAMVAQWWRASRHDTDRLPAIRIYVGTILAAQVLWCVLAIVDLPVTTTFLVMLVPLVIELVGPGYAERRCGGTPWHAHHVAERYGLMVIITLGEGLLGTMVTLTALAETGLTLDIALLALSGTALTFGMWWMYFVVPHAEILHAHRERSFLWGYGQMALFGSVVAVGAGLHAAAYYLEHHTELSLAATLVTVVVPFALFAVVLHLLYAGFSRSLDPFHLVLLAVTAAVLAVPFLLANGSDEITWCLVALSCAPWVTVIGYETVGHRHNRAIISALPD